MAAPFHLYLPHTLLNQGHGSLYGYLDQDKAYVTCLRQCRACPQPEEHYLGRWGEQESTANGLTDKGVLTLNGLVGQYPNVVYHTQPERLVIVIVYDAEKVIAAHFEDDEHFARPLSEKLKTLIKTNQVGADCLHDSIITASIDENIFDKFCYKSVGMMCKFGNGFEYCFHTWIGRQLSSILKLSHTLLHLSMIFCQIKRSDNKQRKRDIVARILVNLLFGMVVYYWLNTYVAFDWLAGLAMDWAGFAAEQTSQLLTWIMGVPGGLKLNKQLTELLGNFFSYHIYLWKGYLYFLKPYLSSIMYYGSLTGFLGFSFQINFFIDLVAMMSLHIHCFYVYAARLYSFQIYALLSLWNLFRGKKSNPLRQRVDSLAYDTRQLFVGTLLFTCLFFLLPTTLVYYVSFTCLRLSVLSFQGILYRIATILCRIPVYRILQVLTSSYEICVKVSFRTVRLAAEVRHLLLSMDLMPLSLTELKLDKFSDDEVVTWPDFLKKLFVGDLIYPWLKVVK